MRAGSIGSPKLESQGNACASIQMALCSDNSRQFAAIRGLKFGVFLGFEVWILVFPWSLDLGIWIFSYGFTRHRTPYNSQRPYPGKFQSKKSLDYNEDAILYFTTSPQLTFNIRVISEIVSEKKYWEWRQTL
jgi:hypothetical protein